MTYEEAEYAVRMVGFLSQRDGSELRILDRDGNLIETRTFRAGVPLSAAAQIGDNLH